MRSLERERDERDRDAYLAGGVPRDIVSGGGEGFTNRDRDRVVAEVRASIQLDRYVTHRELADYNFVNTVRLGEHCADFATIGDLDNGEYVNEAYLAAQNYVTPLALSAAIERVPGVPPGLQDRLTKMEREVLGEEGFLAKHEARLQAIEDRNVGKAVTIGGMTFKDPSDVDAMFAPLSIKDYFGFAYDFSVQVTMALRDTLSMSETLSLKASAVKAGYTDYRAALVESTFETVYPDSIFKRSLSAKDAEQ